MLNFLPIYVPFDSYWQNSKFGDFNIQISHIKKIINTQFICGEENLVKKKHSPLNFDAEYFSSTNQTHKIFKNVQWVMLFPNKSNVLWLVLSY